MWVLAGLWHEVVPASFYQHAEGATHEGVGTILVACLVLGGPMAYMYPLG